MCKLTDVIKRIKKAGTYSSKKNRKSGLSFYLSSTLMENLELLSDWALQVLHKLWSVRMSLQSPGHFQDIEVRQLSQKLLLLLHSALSLRVV